MHNGLRETVLAAPRLAGRPTVMKPPANDAPAGARLRSKPVFALRRSTPLLPVWRASTAADSERGGYAHIRIPLQSDSNCARKR